MFKLAIAFPCLFLSFSLMSWCRELTAPIMPIGLDATHLNLQTLLAVDEQGGSSLEPNLDEVDMDLDE